MAATFGPRLFCWRRSQEARLESYFRRDREGPRLSHQGWQSSIQRFRSSEAAGLMRMQKKRRNGRASTKTTVEDEIAHLRGLDSRGLRARWQSVFKRPAPTHLTRHLLFAIIVYRIQAHRIGAL